MVSYRAVPVNIELMLSKHHRESYVAIEDISRAFRFIKKHVTLVAMISMIMMTGLRSVTLNHNQSPVITLNHNQSPVITFLFVDHHASGRDLYVSLKSDIRLKLCFYFSNYFSSNGLFTFSKYYLICIEISCSVYITVNTFF